MFRITYIIIWLVSISNLQASITFTNTTPSIQSTKESVGDFNIEAKITNISDVSLGSSFGIYLPSSLPDLSPDNIDDGKMFVSYDVFDKNKKIYKSYPGLRVLVYDRNISIKIISRLYTLEAEIDGSSKLRPFEQGDFIRFSFSAKKDINYIAKSRYEDISKFSISSSSIRIIDNTNAITSKAELISISNPAITLTKVGLNAKTDLRFKFNIDGGLKKDYRIEIIFPKQFDISNLKNFKKNIYINQQIANEETIIENNKLSFLLKKDINGDEMELLILGRHIINPIEETKDPFSIKIYLRGKNYIAQYTSSVPSLEQVYFDDKDDSLGYSVGDRIIISLYKDVLVSSFTNKDYISLEREVNGSNFGYLYGFDGINSKNGYASEFAITLGNDFNLTKNLNVSIKNFAIRSKDNILATGDLKFQIPAYYKQYFNKSISEQYDKVYAKNDIDILYNDLSSNTPSASDYNSLNIKDVDNSASYTKGDVLHIQFSSPVDAKEIVQTSSIVLPFSDTSLGSGFSITLDEERKLRENFYTKYKITLGTSPKIVSNSQVSFLKNSVISKDGSTAIGDVIFSSFPVLERPKQSSPNIYFMDRDKNGVYSQGDRVILKFSQNIKAINSKDISVNNSKNLDIGFISTKSSNSGYASVYSVSLGGSVNIANGDKIKIKSSKIVNMYGVSADTKEEFIEFNVVDIIIPKIENISFNDTNMQFTIKLSAKVFDKNNSIKDNIFILNGLDKKSLNELAIKSSINDMSAGVKSIFIDLDDTFLDTIQSGVFDIIINQDAFKTENDVGTDRIAKTFYKSTKLVGLVPEAWNLVAIQDNGTDTTVDNLFKTGKVLKVWVFHNGEWYKGNKNIKRGDGFWIVPNKGVKGIENIESIKASNSNYKSTKLVNVIAKHTDTKSLPLGNSVVDCENLDDKILISDILFNNREDRNVTIFVFDAENSSWIKNKDIYPCEGFLVSITGDL